MFEITPQQNPFMVQDPSFAKPQPSQTMAGTQSAKQLEDQQRQAALISALRQQQQPQQAAPDAGRVVSSGSAASGLDPTAIAGGIDKLVSFFR